MTALCLIVSRQATPFEMTIGVILRDEKRLAHFARRFCIAQRHFPRERASDVHISFWRDCDTVAIVVACATTIVCPLEVPPRVELRDVIVIVAAVPEGSVANAKFGALKMSGDVRVPSGIHGDAVTAVDLRPASRLQPQQLSIRRILCQNEIHASSTGHRSVSESSFVGELSRHIAVPFSVHRDPTNLVVLRAAFLLHPLNDPFRSFLSRRAILA